MMNDTSRQYWESVAQFATKKQRKYIEATHLAVPPVSHALAAEQLGVDRRSVDRAIIRAVDAALERGGIMAEAPSLKVLFIDIETAPMIGRLWSIWEKPMTMDRVDIDWYIMAYAYKWYGSDEVHGKTLHDCTRVPYAKGSEDDRELIEDLWQLFDEADVIIAHNGDKFDIKKIKTRMMLHMILPPAPYKTVDTLKIAKREFAFPSNKLDYIHKVMYGEDEGKEGGGPELWKRCLAGEPQAWDEMRTYNKRDVVILHDVYIRMRAWDRSHPNFGLYVDDDDMRCTVCASEEVYPIPAAKAATNVSMFTAYRCVDCGHVMRDRKNTRTKSAMEVTLVNAR